MLDLLTYFKVPFIGVTEYSDNLQQDSCCLLFWIDRPPLRQFLMDGEFFIGAALATTLTKLALRYVAQTPDKRKQNVCF